MNDLPADTTGRRRRQRAGARLVGVTTVDKRAMTPGARHAVRSLRLTVVVLLAAVAVLVWGRFTESDRTRAEFHRGICKIAERLYSPPASTADGRRRQAANRQFAKDVLNCKIPGTR